MRTVHRALEPGPRNLRSIIASMESVPVDVATLSELSDSSILSCLEERFRSQHSQVGDRCLKHIHPCGMIRNGFDLSFRVM